MRTCPQCGERKRASEFSIRQQVCKPCFASRVRERYANSAEVRKRNLAANTQALQRAREFVFTYLSEHPCVDCGECNPIVLVFDHVRGKKEANISTLVRKRRSNEGLLKEIAKCDVVCANCHAIRTSVQQGWVCLQFG